MVDVSPKVPTRREAIASAFVALKRAVLKQLPKNPKGDLRADSHVSSPAAFTR